MIFVAVDPGTVRAGFCAVESNPAVALPGSAFLSSEFRVRETGSIGAPPKTCRLDRLKIIAWGFRKLFEKHPPEAIVIERAYVGRNAQSAIALGEARGILIDQAARFDCKIEEYTANEARRLIGAGGAAKKHQAHKIASALLSLGAVVDLDAGDAAVLAAAYALSLPTKRAS